MMVLGGMSITPIPEYRPERWLFAHSCKYATHGKTVVLRGRKPALLYLMQFHAFLQEGE